MSTDFLFSVPISIDDAGRRAAVYSLLITFDGPCVVVRALGLTSPLLLSPTAARVAAAALVALADAAEKDSR